MIWTDLRHRPTRPVPQVTPDLPRICLSELPRAWLRTHRFVAEPAVAVTEDEELGKLFEFHGRSGSIGAIADLGAFHRLGRRSFGSMMVR
jgi:hypothetical protein